jgi:hypothetical protein
MTRLFDHRKLDPEQPVQATYEFIPRHQSGPCAVLPRSSRRRQQLRQDNLRKGGRVLPTFLLVRDQVVAKPKAIAIFTACDEAKANEENEAKREP